MLASFDKWKKTEDFPPIVDEIGFIENNNMNQGQQKLIGEENILIFLDLKNFEVEELQAEIINISQIYKEINRIILKYLPSKNPSHMYMMIDGKPKMQDDIKSNSIVSFREFNPGFSNINQSMEIFAKTVSGKTINLNVDSQMSIDSMKQLIYLKTDIHPNQLRILFKGRQLEDGKLLSDYDIIKESTIYLALRLRGTCFPGNAPITLSNGTTKIIKEIELGDIVMCYDFEQQKFKSSTVVFKKITSEKQQLIEIQSHNGRIVCTPNHPVYTQTGWKALEPHPNFQIEKLNAADSIFNSKGKFINIVQINYLKEKEIVYNITTEYPNNFIAFDFLVHNMNKILIEIDGSREEFEVLPYFLVQQIKIMIQKKKEIPVATQQLFYKGILMNDNQALEDYYLKFNASDLDLLILKVIEQSQEDHQAVNQNIYNENSISIITNNEEYQLLIKKNSKQKNLRDLLEASHPIEDIERSLILCDGKPVSYSNINNDIENFNV